MSDAGGMESVEVQQGGAFGGKGQLRPHPPEKSQIMRFLPRVLQIPELTELIINVELYSLPTGMDWFDLRCAAITRYFTNCTQVAYPDAKFLSLWIELQKVIDEESGGPIQTKDLYTGLKDVAGKLSNTFLNAAHQWLPMPISGDSPVTIFARGEGADDSAYEPGRLGIFKEEGDPRFLNKLNFQQVLQKVNLPLDGSAVPVGVFHGASGSGKTSAMLAAAIGAFGAQVLVHFCGDTVCEAIAKRDEFRTLGPKNKLQVVAQHVAALPRDSRDPIVRAAIVDFVRRLNPISSVLQNLCPQESDTAVAIIIDEMGGYNWMLRAVCSDRLKLTEELRRLLRVKQIVFLCGGTGVDFVDSHSTLSTGKIASRQDDFYVVDDFGVQATDWCDLLKTQGDAGELLHHWLMRNNTHLSRLANDLLTNCRSAVLLIKSFSTMDFGKNGIGAVKRRLSADSSLTIEAMVPHELLRCLLQAIQRFKALNGLCRVSEDRAAELVREAVALQMCAVKEDLNTFVLSDKLTSELLLTKYGILTDTWATANSEEAEAKQIAVGVARYRISKALVTMGRLGFGVAILRASMRSWESWEDDICRYFATLARSAMVMKKNHMFPDAAVTLLLSSATRFPCGFQFVDGRSSIKELKQVQAIPVIPGHWRFTADPANNAEGRRKHSFISRSLPCQLEPGLDEETMATVVNDIIAALEQCDFLVLRNAPMAKYADVICVNSPGKELWLVQCKHSEAKKMKVSFSAELAKMGFQESPDSNLTSAQFTHTLSSQLGLRAIRYFMCLGHGAETKGAYVPEKFRSVPNVHVLEYPYFDYGVIAPRFNNDVPPMTDADTWEEEVPDASNDGDKRKRPRYE